MKIVPQRLDRAGARGGERASWRNHEERSRPRMSMHDVSRSVAIEPVWVVAIYLSSQPAAQITMPWSTLRALRWRAGARPRSPSPRGAARAADPAPPDLVGDDMTEQTACADGRPDARGKMLFRVSSIGAAGLQRHRGSFMSIFRP
jgi:hypothetical protein